MNSEPEHPQQDAPPLPAGAVCLECEYQLRGLSTNVCPECGTSFDPDDPSTYGPQSTRRTKKARQHPTILDGVLLFASILFLLVDISGPGQSMLRLGGSIVATLLVFKLGNERIGRPSKRRSRGNRHGNQPKRSWRYRWWPPLMLTLLITACLYPWPAYLRFQVSKSAFETALKGIPATTGTMPLPIGLYRIQAITTKRTGCVFFRVETGPASFEAHGFWYVPLGAPMPKFPDFVSNRVAANWYTGSERL